MLKKPRLVNKTQLFLFYIETILPFEMKNKCKAYNDNSGMVVPIPSRIYWYCYDVRKFTY